VADLAPNAIRARTGDRIHSPGTETLNLAITSLQATCKLTRIERLCFHSPSAPIYNQKQLRVIYAMLQCTVIASKQVRYEKKYIPIAEGL
jgi:hypothetical protein